MERPKVFISYSTSDIAVVRAVANAMRPHAEPRFWGRFQIPGTLAWARIFQEIDNCDLMFVIITGSTLNRGLAVGQEVGRARAKDKVIVPLVSEGIRDSDLGCLGGITYIRFDPMKPLALLYRVKATVLRLSAYKKRAAMLQDQQRKRDLTFFSVLALGAVAAIANMDDA